MTVYDRIKKLCEQQGVSVSKMEREIGISKGATYKWKNSSPSMEVLQKLAEYFHVSSQYIITGEMPTRESYYYDPEVQEIAEEMATRPEMKVLFKASRNLTKEQIEAINNIVNTMK